MREWMAYDKTGALLWQFRIRPIAGEWALTVERKDKPGRKIVRLFDREGDADDEADILMYVFGLMLPS